MNMSRSKNIKKEFENLFVSISTIAETKLKQSTICKSTIESFVKE